MDFFCSFNDVNHVRTQQEAQQEHRSSHPLEIQHHVIGVASQYVDSGQVH